MRTYKEIDAVIRAGVNRSPRTLPCGHLFGGVGAGPAPEVIGRSAYDDSSSPNSSTIEPFATSAYALPSRVNTSESVSSASHAAKARS